VECQGDRITLFVNDQEIEKAQDDTFSDGYVGFVLFLNGSAVFRDLLVDELR
jgi:hypothetical protein